MAVGVLVMMVMMVMMLVVIVMATVFTLTGLLPWGTAATDSAWEGVMAASLAVA